LTLSKSIKHGLLPYKPKVIMTNQNVYAGASSTIKIALIGCGGRGTGAAVQALNTGKDVKLVAMADVFRDQLDNSYDNLISNPDIKDQVDVPEQNKFAGFDAYKDATALADVVVLAAPPGFRPMHLEEAVRLNKHIFMEKPVAVDAPGVRSVLASIKKAQEKNLNVVVGLQRRFLETYTGGTVEKIHNGIIGDIIAAQCYWKIGFIREPQRIPGQTEMEYQLRNWYHFTWLSGDHIEDTHIHNLDVVNWVLQAYPVRAQGMGGREIPYAKDREGVIYDHHFVEFEYPNGVLVNSQALQINNCHVKLGEHFMGTKGRAETSFETAFIKDYNGSELFAYSQRQSRKAPNSQQVEHDVLFDHIRKGTVKNDAEYGAYSTMTSILGRMATYSGQLISWDDAINSNISIGPKEYSFDAEAPLLPDANGGYNFPVPGKTSVL
jgi:myo-inositol 2-dehydrogenase / D-chiro-inositol 1-dehydrogenase